MAERRTNDEVRARMWAAVLEAAMKKHGRTSERGMNKIIASDAGVQPQSVSEWKRGKAYPSTETLRKLASVYGVSAAHLSGMTTDEGSYPPADILMQKAATLTESIASQLLPNGSIEQFSQIMRRANELYLEGKSDGDAHMILFNEVVRMKDSVK